MPSSSWAKTSGQWSTHSPSPVHKSWSIHTRMTPLTLPSVTGGAANRRHGYCGAVQEPVAKQIEHHWDRPTGRVEDPWAWLRDRNDPDTIAYLEAENKYTDAWFADHADLVETIFGEIKSRIQETDLTAPIRDGKWWY